jgi:hypothetical protein
VTEPGRSRKPPIVNSRFSGASPLIVVS